MSATIGPRSVGQSAAGAGAPLVRGTVNQLFFDAVERYDKPNAMLAKADGVYQPISHRTIAERVRRVALGLRALGVRRGDRVGLLSETRPEWAIVDFGCLTAGITDVPLYPTLPAEQISYIVRDAGAVAVFVSTEEQARKIAQARDGLPALAHVIGFGQSTWPGVDLTLAALEAKGAAVDTATGIAQYRAEALGVGPDDVATIIYTSGTTGEPKGAMLTHDNFYSNVRALLAVAPVGVEDVSLSFLPLSHIFERTVGYYLMFAAGVSIGYAESLDALAVNFGEVRPTFAAAVPRVYEKLYARVLENALAGGALKKRIFFWAKRVADRAADLRLAHRQPGGLLGVKYRIADRLVLSKLRERLGGRIRFFLSGSAPLSPEINRFFYSAGLTILEGYGLTETSPVIACNRPGDIKIGTVGLPLPGVEVKIAADGEILTRGPHVMKGYFNKPEATHEVIDADGWFRTGDVGVLEGGYLRITDRKKDIIVTAGGKNIAPQPIENQAKMNKYVTEAVMIGDKRRFPVMLIVPNFGHLEQWAKLENLTWTDRQQLLAQPLVQAKMEQEVLGGLRGLAKFETPKKIRLLATEFSLDSGELTPTQKVKRRVVERNYAELIEELYTEGPGSPGRDSDEG